MPAAEPKEGTGFELHVAAALKTDTHKTDGKTIDIRSYYLNPVPKTYTKEMTGASYDVTVDISASEDDIEYAIECKSSRHRDQILDEKTDQFLEAMIEFLALEKFVELSKWRLNYMLATNFPISRRISAIVQTGSSQQLEMLRKNIAKCGTRKYHEGFNPETVSVDRIVKVFGNLTLIEFPDRYLRLKMSSDPEYKNCYEAYSERLKKLRSQVISKNSAEVDRFERVSFLCRSLDHAVCKDIRVRDVVCHIGDVSHFMGRLAGFEKDSTPVRLVRANELEYSAKDVVRPNHLSPKEAAEIITVALNDLAKNAYLLYLVPGTYDVVLINHEYMIERIKKTLEPETLQYNLDHVSELDGLGSTLKISIAQFILSTYHISQDEDNFISNDEIDGS